MISRGMQDAVLIATDRDRAKNLEPSWVRGYTGPREYPPKKKLAERLKERTSD